MRHMSAQFTGLSSVSNINISEKPRCGRDRGTHEALRKAIGALPHTIPKGLLLGALLLQAPDN